jgi:hypothetical protein
MDDQRSSGKVVVVDIDVPFGSVVRLVTKVAFAAIPLYIGGWIVVLLVFGAANVVRHLLFP